MITIAPARTCPGQGDGPPVGVIVQRKVPGVRKRRREVCPPVSVVTSPEAPPVVDAGDAAVARLCWTLATAPVIVGLAFSIVRDFLAGRLGVDAIALLSMTAALALGEPLAGAVVALMYSGGNVLDVGGE